MTPPGGSAFSSARAAALSLPPDERKDLVVTLLDSLTDPFEDPEGVRQAWNAEIARRIDEMTSGTVIGYSVDEFFAELDRRRSKRGVR
jgi:putative addiction module component (TIGR02574 family)